MKIAMVTIYPHEGVTVANVGGVGWHTRALAKSLVSRDGVHVLVLAQQLDGREEEKENGRIQIRRCWRPGALFFLPLIREIRKKNPDVVHLQHELFLYGGILSALMFPVLLAALRVSRHKIVVTLHGVSHPHDVDEQFVSLGGLKVPPVFVRCVLWALFRLIAEISHFQIVHDEVFKRIMVEGYGAKAERVVVIPLPYLYDQPRIVQEKEEAREALGIAHSFVALFFGFISLYKGVQLLIEGFDLFRRDHPDSLLIIAGGPHPRLCDEPQYISHYQGLKDRAIETLGDNLLWKGFVLEDEIEQVFGAADLCVLPYIKLLSCSGAAMHAMAMGVPLLVSEALSPLFPNGCRSFGASAEDLRAALSEFFTERDKHETGIPGDMDGCRPSNVSRATYQLYEAICGGHA